jgi:pimeloyl-ACP methyl ester carboxylesterase
MATFVCLHGAGCWGSHWDLVGADLRAAGHAVVAPDLPSDQEVGLAAYRDVVVDAIDDAGATGPIVVVAQSMAGFIAPLVADVRAVDLLVLVAAMVPKPGESGGEWWTATGHHDAYAAQALPDDSEETVFTHDVPAEVLAAIAEPRDQTGTLFEEPWPLAAWPDVPTRFLLCRDDRFFPADWMRGVVEERLGITPTEVPGGHCAYLAHPHELASAILACWQVRAVTIG